MLQLHRRTLDVIVTWLRDLLIWISDMKSTGIFLFAITFRWGQVRAGQRTAPVTVHFKLMGKLILVNEISIGEKLWMNVSFSWSYELEQRWIQGTAMGAQL